jgi:hypothetical protein
MAALVGLAAATGCGSTSSTSSGGGGGAGGSGGSTDTGGHKAVAFVTSATYNGNLQMAGNGTSGLDGADKLCQKAATDAGLTGTFKAWLSDKTTNAIDRLKDVEGGWYTAGSAPYLIFDSKASIPAGPKSSITNEKGNGLAAEVWTGTQTDGTKQTMDGFVGTSANCEGWILSSGDSGSTGEALSAGGSWTQSSQSQCQAEHSLYCFEQ